MRRRHEQPRAISRMRANLPQMSAAMTKIAELILADPALPLDLSITELAQRAGTSAATVTRFCRLVGYSGYVQLRVGLAAELGRDDASESWRTDIGRSYAPDDAPADVLSKLLNAHARALEATAELVDIEEVTRIAKAIWQCRHLDIYGIANSGTMAADLQGRLYRIGVNAHAWDEAHKGLASAAILTRDAIAIGISNSGRTKETLEMLELAKENGAFTVAITRDRMSPLARVADTCIVNASPDRAAQPDDPSARYAQILVLDLLYLLVAQQDFTTAADRLAATRLAVSSHRRPPTRARGPIRSSSSS